MNIIIKKAVILHQVINQKRKNEKDYLLIQDIDMNYFFTELNKNFKIWRRLKKAPSFLYDRMLFVLRCLQKSPDIR